MQRRSFLAGVLGGLALAPVAQAIATQGRRRLIVVHAWGGWDVTFALDPKAREAVDGPYVDEALSDPYDRQEIATVSGIPLLVDPVRRPNVTTFFENHGHRTTLLNGLQVGAVGHHDGVRRILCGSPDIGRPDISAIIGADGLADGLLGTIDFSGTGHFGPFDARSIRLGPRGQLRALLDPGVRYPTPADMSLQRPIPLPTPARRDAVNHWLDDRIASAIPAADATSAARLEQRRESLTRAQRLQQAEISDSLPLGLRDALRTNIPAAIDLLEADVCRTVLLDSGEHWDSHADQFRQHAAYNRLFINLGVLVNGLLLRGLSDVDVVVVSEMSRSPRRNPDGGTEHWPTTSALFIDLQGRSGGRAIGQTNDALLPEPIDLATGRPSDVGVIPRYDHLAAALLAHADVDPGDWLPDVPSLTAFTS